jgi:ricin-type beta-trefoil lectin protein
MIESIFRKAYSLAAAALCLGASSACDDSIDGPGDALGEARAGLEAAAEPGREPGAERSTYFHAEVHPPHWLPWTTDGAAGIESGPAFLTHGLRCSGKYCDDVSLLSVESGYTQTNSWWTDYFSEEGSNERVCANNGFVTGLRCSGDYCDSISLRCSQVNNGGVRANCYWSAPISEESGGKFVAPESTYLAGVRCSGRYCDNKQLYLCQADAGGPSFDVAALAAQYAPRLRFDQEFGTGSGGQSKCFPGDPGAYFAARANGVDPIALCNKDYAPVQNHQIPTYYVASQVGTNTVLIRYWYFYAWQSSCFASAGSHAADWESMAVLVVGGQLRRVAWYQHGGWYSHEAGDFQTAGSHPVGYVGKNAHGTYHDDGGSGGCLYFEDFRNPGAKDYHMDTWNNLAPLYRGGGAPAWMNCEGSGCFDGVGHPLEQTGDLRGMGGCGKDGCGRTSVGENMPFQNDPTGAEYATIFAEHSGRAIDVPGGSTADGVKLYQFANAGADNQRWLLESTGDGHFTLRARHSGKCMDVPGGSTAGGANVIQHGCNGGDNQRFRLTPYGDGYFAVQAKHSNQCLDIAGGAMGDGGQLVQWPCAWTTNESFRFVP